MGLSRVLTVQAICVTSWYKLGPNLQSTLPEPTYTDSTEPTHSSTRSTYNWNGDHYVGIQPIDLTSSVTNKMFKVENNRLQLSLLVEWRFNNLDASFEKIVGISQRTVMVYSDLVESSVVGSSKFPLLCEVQLLRTGDGRSTVEPLHHQWIKSEGINWISSKWRLPHPADPWPSYLPAKPS